jgi:tetratricopeptide (TPR) repeat protein
LDKHLLFSREVNGETRFAMFETLREFALEHLEASGIGLEAYQHYAGYFASFHDRFYNQINRLEPEIDNFRAVLRWSIDTDQVAPGLRIAGNSWFWTQWNSEWRFWLEGLLYSPGTQAAEPPLRCSGLFHLVFQALIEGDVARCQQRLDEYEAAAKAFDLTGLQPVVFYLRGYLRILREDYEGAIAAFGQGLKISEELGLQAWVAVSHGGMGDCLLLLTDQDPNSLLLRSGILSCLGYSALEKGDLRAALSLLEQSLQEASALGFKSGYADCLNAMAAIAQKQGYQYRAARLYGAVQALAGTAGLLSHEPALKILHRRYLADLRREMDPAELERAWQEGQAMTLEDALRAGLAVEVAD